MTRVLARWLLVAAVGAGIACHRSAPETQPDPTSDALLQVDNRAFNDVVVYIVRNTQRIRLGIVNGNSTSTFTIPNQDITTGPISFLADPIGSDRTPVSEEIVVEPGDVVTITIPSN